MILSFADRDTERFAAGERVKRFDGFAEQAVVRLERLDAAASLDQLRAFRGNRLELLRGNRAGQHSIRINRQWRICFVWNDHLGAAERVQIIDYH